MFRFFTTFHQNFRKLILLVPLLLSSNFQAHAATASDVIVYGATPGGFCAAIAAAREGASVILLEPTSHVGGMNTGGLSFSDSNQTIRSTVMGLFDEWHTRIQEDYESRGITLPYDVSVKDQSYWTYEPSVAARVTTQMLEEAGVQVLIGHVLTSVVKEGVRVTRLITESGEEFSARVFIDATYEGDLMAAAGVSWTIGREGKSAYGESLAGKRYPKAKMAISGFDDSGNPLPLITTTDAGPTDEGDSNVMTYSFRLCLTKAADRVPFPEPAAYDPNRFEVIRRYLAVEPNPPLLFDLYPLPNGKYDANNGIWMQFSLGLVGGGNSWCEADADRRADIFEEHKQYTLELYKFLTTDSAVPENLRNALAAYGLCPDEFTDNGYWPPQLYVREGRRMQGMYVLSQNDISGEPQKEDSIGVSSFPIDSHDCQRVALADGVINEGTIFPVRMSGRGYGYAYQIPYRAILPVSTECDNLLVPVALSCTHVAFSSIRVEPTWMVIGQSAGVAAALTAEQDVAVQDLPYSNLSSALLAQNQVLELPAQFQPLSGIVLDNIDAELQGVWNTSTNFDSFVGINYAYAGTTQATGDGSSVATFRFTAPQAGRYELNMAYSPHYTRATNVPVSITSGLHVSTFTVDQTISMEAGAIVRPIGTVDLDSDVETVITVSNTDTNGFVILDALQLVSDFDTWAQGFSGFTDTDPVSDPDGDGVTNDEEYAFGLDPTLSTSACPNLGGFSLASSSFQYTRRNPDLTGKSYTYQYSTTLGQDSWFSFTPDNNPEAEAFGEPVQTVPVSVPAGLLAEPALFFRVQVE